MSSAAHTQGGVPVEACSGPFRSRSSRFASASRTLSMVTAGGCTVAAASGAPMVVIVRGGGCSSPVWKAART